MSGPLKLTITDGPEIKGRASLHVAVMMGETLEGAHYVRQGDTMIINDPEGEKVRVEYVWLEPMEATETRSEPELPAWVTDPIESAVSPQSGERPASLDGGGVKTHSGEAEGVFEEAMNEAYKERET